MNRCRTVGLLFAICAASLVVACGDSNGPTPQPPAAPDGLVATAFSTTEIVITWRDNASNEDGFRVEQAPGGTMTFTEIATVANRTGFQHTGLSAETAYSYRVRAYNAAGPSGYSNIATTTTTPTPADVNDLEGTWTLEPRPLFDCGSNTLALDTVRTLLTAPGVMTFTLKGQLYDGRVMEGSETVALGAGNTFAVSGTKTYPYATFTFKLDGRFIGSNRFSATVRITDTRIGKLGCDQPVTGVIGNRTMSLLPTSLTLARGASGVFTVAVPADESTSAEVTLGIASQIGIVPASVTIQPGENRVSFTVTGTDPGTAIITASLNGLSVTSTLVVSP